MPVLASNAAKWLFTVSTAADQVAKLIVSAAGARAMPPSSAAQPRPTAAVDLRNERRLRFLVIATWLPFESPAGYANAAATTIVQLGQARKRHDRRIDEADLVMVAPHEVGVADRTLRSRARSRRRTRRSRNGLGHEPHFVDRGAPEGTLTAPVGASHTTPASPPSPGGRRRHHRPRSGRSPSAPRASWARRRAHTWLRSPAAAPGGRRRWG